MTSEIGRELKVSELKLDTVVVLHKPGRPAATMWVREVAEVFVWFHAGVTNTEFIAMRCGDGLNEIEDDSRTRMKIYEYLGEV